MVTIKNYVKVSSLEEAYELNQKRENIVLGGMLWIKMGKRSVQTAIDLAGLGLDRIEEDEEQFSIGAMCPLRELETHSGLETAFGTGIRESLRHIVGVQFRNSATIGGSIYGRFGFSDILTCLLALDTYVELYKKGTIPLKEFVDLPQDHDILTRIMIRKDERALVYQSFRMTKTDFPILTSAVSAAKDKIYVAVGARPMKAALAEINRIGLPVEARAKEIAGSFKYGSNMRGSAEYRRHLAAVSISRALKALDGGAL